MSIIIISIFAISLVMKLKAHISLEFHNTKETISNTAIN